MPKRWISDFSRCAVVAVAVLTATKDTQFAALMSCPGSLGPMNAGTKCPRSENRVRRTLQVIAIDDAAVDGEALPSASLQPARSDLPPATCHLQPATHS